MSDTDSIKSTEGVGDEYRQYRNLELPFNYVNSRAIILRRNDGALLGAMYNGKTKFNLPGGIVEDGDRPDRSMVKELEEIKIILLGADDKWRDRLSVDYFPLKRALNMWYIFLVDDVQLGDNIDIYELRWLDQTQDVWYQGMREKICLAIQQFCPDLLRVNISLLESW